MGPYVKAGQQTKHLLTHNKFRCIQHTSADQTPIHCVPVASSGLKLKGGGRVKSGRSGAPNPGKFGLSCKANKCNDAGTGDIGVQPTLFPGECRGRYKVQLNPFTKRDNVTGLGIKQQLPRHLVNVNFGNTCQPISIRFFTIHGKEKTRRG